jgi:integrase
VPVLRIDRQLTRETVAAGRPVLGPVRTPSSDRRVAIRTAWEVWRAAAAIAGAPGGDGWHELRHFHASLLVAGGASPVAVTHRLEHRDANETLRTYAHLWPDDDERMRDASDGIIRIRDDGADER